MNINAGSHSLENILVRNMKEKKRPTFSAVFDKLNKRTAQMNSYMPLNSVLTNEQLFRYYVKDTMPLLQKSNDTFGDSEEGSMISSLMKKLGLNETPLNNSNVEALTGTVNSLSNQMSDGISNPQGQPFIQDTSNNAFTGYKKKMLTLSDEEYDNYNFEYGAGAGYYIKELIKYFNDPSNRHGVDLENISYDDFFDDDNFDNLIDQINNQTFINAELDSPESKQFFDAVFGSGALNKIERMVKTNPNFNNMKIEDLVNLPQFKSMSSKGKGKYGFIDDIVNDMVDNSTGRHGFINDIVNDMFDNATNDNIVDNEAGSKDIVFDEDFLKLYYGAYGDKNHILATMSPQYLSEYQMLSEEYSQVSSEILNRNKITFSGSNLTGNRFQNPNAKPRKIVFDDDFKKVFFADNALISEAIKKMPYDRYNEFTSMRKEYQNLDYAVKIKDLGIFEGYDIKADNRFLVQNDPNEFQKELDKLKVMNMPPPEQSIVVRGRGAPRKPDNVGSEKAVKARLKEREKYAKKKLSSIETKGGTMSAAMGAISSVIASSPKAKTMKSFFQK